MMKTILFPTDFSENSNHAFRYAKTMARAKKAKLILLYVYNLPLVAPINAFTSREHTLGLIDHNLREAAQEHMKIYTDELDLMDDEYEVVIRDGYVADEIVNFCNREEINLIVMGTKGKSNHRDFLMGSTTAKVTQRTSIPLLAIPESAAIKAFSKIVFATDLIYNSDNELNKSIEFAQINDATLTFLHLNIKGGEHPKEVQKLRDFIQQHSYKKLDLVVSDCKNVIDGLTAFLKDRDTDLLALSNHTKSLYEKLFHKSVTREMVLHSHIPLLIFSKKIHPIIFF